MLNLIILGASAGILATQAWLARRSHLAYSQRFDDAFRQALEVIANLTALNEGAKKVIADLKDERLLATSLTETITADRDTAVEHIAYLKRTSELFGRYQSQFEQHLTQTHKAFEDQLAAGASQLSQQSAANAAAIGTCFDQFHDRVDARVKAETAKWVFGTGGGGIVAAYQYCVRCTARSAVWHMLPDEGPVCNKCFTGS